jgi:hypothetical protein
MLVAQVAIGLHRKRPPVFVTEPTGNCGDVHAGFDATGGERVAQALHFVMNSLQSAAWVFDKVRKNERQLCK